MRTIADLRREPGLLAQYVELRNRHAGALLTNPVTEEQTRRWLATGEAEVRLLREGELLLGAAVLYPRRGGEVALFVRESGRGSGGELLRAVEEAARERGVGRLWAWVQRGNGAARRVFEKSGYLPAGEERRTFAGRELDGLLFARSPEGPPAGAGAAVRHTQEEYGLRTEAAAFPLMCVLSFVYVCNARCPSCPYTNSSIRADYRDTPVMGAATFRIIADQCGEHGAWVRISGGGEPMLHPRAVELLLYAKKAGAKVGLITNGSRFTAESTERLLEAQVDMIEFSADAADAGTYARVRTGLDWETLLRNVERMVRRRNELGSATRIIVSGINQVGVDIDQVARFWEARVDSFQKRKYLTWGINDPARSADAAPYLPPEELVPCPFIFERLNIDSRGRVMVCGFDIAAKTDLGNVHEKTIREIWLGEGFERYRRLHLARRGREIELCRECPDWQFRSWQHNYWKLVRTAEEKRQGRPAALDLQDMEGCAAEPGGEGTPPR